MLIEGQASQGERLFSKYHQMYFRVYKVGLISSIVGDTFFKMGAGKSWLGLKAGELVDKNFNVDKSCFSPREFLQQIDNISESGKSEQVVIMDEGSITAPSNAWYSMTNKAIAYTMMTFRNLNSLAIIITPNLQWIDKKLRMLMNHWGYMSPRIARDKNGNRYKQYYLNYFQVRTDLFDDRIYYRKIKYYDTDLNKMAIADKWRIGKPSEDLTEEYEKKSKKFKHKIRSGFLKDIQSFEEKAGIEETPDFTNTQLIDKALESPYIIAKLKEKNKVPRDVLMYELEEIYKKENITLQIPQSKANYLADKLKMVWNGGKRG